ncbi:MAG: hypothetical protein KGI25_00550 [Thaumarchaeota archaeon]|nr:hypothetical protein [Nitrososphaerota archaeon]
MQRIDFLVKESKKDLRTDSFRLEKVEINHEPIQIKKEESRRQENQQPAVSDNLEFFTGFAWCQVLIFKSWIEASDKLVKMQAEKGDGAIEMSSLYVDVHEEIFTNLFKSRLYASNLGRMINASMLMMKNWQNLTYSSSSDNTNNSNKNK